MKTFFPVAGRPPFPVFIHAYLESERLGLLQGTDNDTAFPLSIYYEILPKTFNGYLSIQLE